MADLNTEIQTLSEDVFSQLMGDLPDKTVTPKDIVGSSKLEEPKEDKQASSKKETKEAKEASKTKEEEKKEELTLSQEELEKQMKAALDDDEEEDTSKEQESKTKVDKDTSSSILQTQAELLIERGLWREFEGMEEFEWSNENYANLVEQQAIWQAEDMFSELIDSTGVYGKAIISHIQNGGNAEEIIDLFKEAKKIESFDIETEEGKTALLTKYYKDLGWKDAKIKRTIDAAIDSNTIDEDVADAKAEMEQAIQEEVASKQRNQEAYLKAQKEAEEKFAENITNALKERKDLANDQKRDIYNSLLVYDKKLQDGRVVNQFALDFAKLQSDPKKYIDLVLFVRDYDKYIETLSKNEEKKAVRKTWDFIKGNGAVSKTVGAGGHSKSTSKDKSDLVIDYRSLIN